MTQFRSIVNESGTSLTSDREARPEAQDKSFVAGQKTEGDNRSRGVDSTSALARSDTASHGSPVHHREDLLVSAIFVCVLTFFFFSSIYTCLTTTKQIAEQENRLLAPFPRLRNVRHDLPLFADKFASFYNDHFAFRLPMISGRNWVLFTLLRSSGSPMIAIGNTGWLFFTDEPTLAAELNDTPFSEDNLKLWAKTLCMRRDVLAAHGIKYIFFVAPEKASIYPEYLPVGWRRHPGITRLDQLQTYLKEHTDLDVFDPKSIILENKPKGRVLYHSHDTHWNQYGAFLVAQKLLNHIGQYFPVVKPFPQHTVAMEDGFRGDMAKMLGLGGAAF